MANLYSDNPIVEIVALKGADGTTPPIDSQLSDTSTNPVENKVIKENIDIINNGLGAIGAQLNNKQDELISGENIRTINGNSLLGEGDIVIESGETITVDDELSDTSENPVQNKVIAAALAGKQDALVIDDEMSDTSENPVQNKVVKDYIDSEGELLEADINSINSKIPAQASADNQLADKDFVNSSISTATATFRGTFETLAALQATDGDKNDYAFYSHKDAAGNTIYDRYKYVGIKEKRLPDGYTEVANISGGYINLNKIPRFDWHVIIKVSSPVFAIGSNTVPVFGVRENNTRWEILKPSYENPLRVIFPNNNVSSNVTNNDVHIIEVKSNGATFFDGVFKGKLSTSGTAPTLSAYLLGIHRTTDVWHQDNVACYGLTIYDSEENLLADLVPCVRDSDSSIGVYDLTGNINPDTNTSFYSGATLYTPLATDLWEFEYSLNNSSFTAEQWAAVNSGLVTNVTATGFDANATQVLKNINGVLTWVTE